MYVPWGISDKIGTIGNVQLNGKDWKCIAECERMPVLLDITYFVEN